MIKHLIIALSLFTLTYHTGICQQPLWKISPGLNDYAVVGNDTSIANLKNLLLQDNKIASYSSAATLLAYHYGSTERHFLLDVLRKNAYKDSIDYDGLKYRLYQELRGYLGDQGAIAGMDSIARFARYPYTRLDAVASLAIAGHYEHFDIVKEAYTNTLQRDNARFCLQLYGRDSRFTVEAGDILAVTVQDSTAITPVLINVGALAEFDKPRAVTLLHQRFLSEEGENRALLFNELKLQDPDGQPERTVWAVPRELNEVNRSFYFPDYSGVISGFYSKRYLEPWYVKFVVDWLKTETSRLVKVDVLNSFVKVFKPIAPLPSTPVLALIDTLVSYKNQFVSFAWLGDEHFIKELDNDLENAQKHLAKGDSVNTAKEVEKFQDKVKKEYERTIDNEKKNKPRDKRFVTEEGYKFLFYNAKYIMDRLPRKK